MTVRQRKPAFVFSESLYRLLLHCYPRKFRRVYGREMLLTFRASYSAALQQTGSQGVARLWTFVLYDLLKTACVERGRACIEQFRRLSGLEKELLMGFTIDAALCTDIGRKRPSNEDNMTSVIPADPEVLAHKGALFVVADGLGGHERGEVASLLTVEGVRARYYQNIDEDVASALAQAVKFANNSIYQQHTGENAASVKAMGSTCLAAVVHENSAYIANVGDSRAYIVRQGQARQVSLDHSWVAEQVSAGLLTEEQARTHERRNIITRCLGSESDVEVDLFVEKVEPGDVLVLCTDGLSGLVSAAELCAIVAQYGPQDSVTRLVACANERGGPDNITAIVARVGQMEQVVAA